MIDSTFFDGMTPLHWLGLIVVAVIWLAPAYFAIRPQKRIGRGWGRPGMIRFLGRAIGVDGGMFGQTTVEPGYGYEYDANPNPSPAAQEKAAEHMRIVDQYNEDLDTPLDNL
jgi:hypothetical protein